MTSPHRIARVCLGLLLLLGPSLAQAQGPTRFRVQVGGGGAFMTSGAYFTGPGALELSGGDALAGVLQVSVPVHRSFTVVVGGAYARPDFQLQGIPLIGSVGLNGARLLFADAAVRGRMPLGDVSAAVAGTSPVAFVQAGAGLARYSVDGTVAGTRVDESATNFAGALAAGIELPFSERFGVEVMAKDYIASFKSVRDLAALGIEGRTTHTLLLGVSARVGL